MPNYHEGGKKRMRNTLEKMIEERERERSKNGEE